MNKSCDMKNDAADDRKWKVLKSEYMARRPWFTVRKEHVRLANGRESKEFYVYEYPDWVNVIAITHDGDFVMIKQYRHGVGRTDFELCAGVIETGEEPIDAARRELLEETGFGGGEWENLCVIAPNPSTQNNFVHCFLARNVRKFKEQELDGAEDISVHIMRPEEVFEMVKDEQIIQSLMLVPLWKYFALYRKDLL